MLFGEIRERSDARYERIGEMRENRRDARESARYERDPMRDARESARYKRIGEMRDSREIRCDFAVARIEIRAI
jgi:uncharacterized coiled-coil DUF342 family protein